MNETSDVTTLALLNLIRLLAAELVAGEHRDDVARLIGAVDRQLAATPLPRGIDVNDARAGIARARELLQPYMVRVRDLAMAVRAHGEAAAAPAGGSVRSLPSSRYLQ